MKFHTCANCLQFEGHICINDNNIDQIFRKHLHLLDNFRQFDVYVYFLQHIVLCKL